MHSALRKMGNSTGLIVPKAVLREAGIASGTTLDLIVEDGRIIASPVRDLPRAGWAEAAALIAADPEPADEAAWRGFANEGDADLTW
jgi:antitoxin MazE